MSNGTKIKTMKDDLLEIENKVSQSVKIPQKQQESATLSTNATSAQKPSGGFSLPKTAPKRDDLKTKELRNIVGRLAKNRSGDASISARNATAADFKPDIKTTIPEANELKALIDRISKREGESEKPLAKSNAAGNIKSPEIKSAEKPEVPPAKIETTENPLKPVVSERIIPPAKKTVISEQKNIPVEKPDLDALIKPISRQSSKMEEKEAAAPRKKTSAEISPEKLSQRKQPAPQDGGPALEEKILETKEVLENIEKKEKELKELLEKMAKNKQDGASGSDSKTETVSQGPSKRYGPENVQIEKTAAPFETTYLDKLVGSDEKPSLKSLGIKETPPSGQKNIAAKKTETKKEKPIMKKIRERLFGMEKEIAQTRPETEKKPSLDSENRTETDAKPESYFKKIAQEKTLPAPKLESVEEKFSSLPENQQYSAIKPDKINEFENPSGIIVKNEPGTDTKKDEELAKTRRNYLNSQYVSPTNRLVFGKQEHYSSVRRHIEERHLNADLNDLESKVSNNNIAALSDKEEKKKLKARIISKYHIKSSPFLRNVLIIAVIAIVIGGVVLYNYLSNVIKNNPPAITAPLVSGTELKEFSGIKDALEITAEKLKNPTTLRDEANKKFLSDPDLRFFKLVIKDNKGNIVEPRNALEGIGINPLALPQAFLESTENEYSLIVFKTPRLTARLGLAIRLKSPEAMQSAMISWEKDKIKMKDALNPLFVSDRTSDIQNSYFQSGSYKGVNLRYVSLPDKNTAIDYFIYKNMFVVATAKDDAFRLIDMLTAAK